MKSSSLKLAFEPEVAKIPHSENPVSQDLALPHSSSIEVKERAR